MSIFRSAATKQAHHLKRLGTRYQSTQIVKSEFQAERDAVKAHAAESAGTWKKISIFVCIPALLASGYNAYTLYEHHQEHAKEHPKEWVKYPYINYRARDYFWGKNSLFFNPKVNLDATEDSS
ncbi:cytochrome c oxidase, subunit VIa [Cokeromyces recurvatus]|uniref:cytochrome c oxidase, subunit VIa n=1 Tax=Cokeromyces recurvatus TaxID=90255 RepID=UPI00221F4A46|nr:cytochrome c oxidase, subunit VIa [Cokeromyces recurvatus]KAI7898632.1 cytochrome c oxidase, subunit VIa [Cokeromyces recurvatus]